MNELHFDFSAFLVLATAITGLIWLIDRLFFAKRRDDHAKEPTIVEYSRSFFPVILAVLVIRSFFFEPFKIPSSSMYPTLFIGDHILVNKYAYGVRLPVLNNKVIPVGEPARGDVAVFRFPEDQSQDYIKRIVGLPGDVISMKGKQLFINGEPMEQTIIGRYEGVGQGRGATGLQERIENLDSVEHKILVRPQRFQNHSGQSWTVPEGHYFVMGDNRDNSRDSRAWGFMPEENLVGRANLIWFNWDTAAGGVGWDRIGDSIE